MKAPVLPVALALALATAGVGAAVTLDAPGHVAVESATVAARGGEPGAAWSIADWRDRDTGVSGVFDKDGATTLPPLPCGYYRISPSLATLAVVKPPESCVLDHDSFYGVDSAQSWLSLPELLDCPWNGGDTFRTVSDLIRLAGVPHVRDRLAWRNVNPRPGVFDYGHYMRNAYLLHERGLLISGMFHDAPQWAGLLRKLPSDLGAVHDFCAAVAAAFGDRMGDWEFWNEEEIQFAPEPVWDYAAALKAAYLGFKAGRPGVTVLPGALCQEPDSPYARALFDNDAAKFSDVFNYHTYAAPARYPRIFAAQRNFMERYGIGGRAIWLTESGTHMEGHAKEDGVRKGLKAHSPDQELVLAEFYPKSQIALQMEGVARNYYFVFCPYNESRGAKDWGVMRRDGTVKPGYAAIATMAREVGAARLVGEINVGDGLRAYLFAQPDGSQTVAFWSASPVDTATDGLVSATPDYAREMVLRLAGPTVGQERFRLSDLCGMVSSVMATNGVLALSATRFPSYVSGLGGLVADVPARPAGKVMPYEPAVDEDLSVIIRVDLNHDDFAISNQKTLAILKGDSGRVRVQVWNMDGIAKVGRVNVGGAKLEGLPETIVLAPRGAGPAEFDCVLSPSGESSEGELVLTGLFGGRRSSRLSMSVRYEKRILDFCVAIPIEWRNPKNWTRNDSAQSYSATWDDAEQAVRFDIAWTDSRADRWFYPVYRLKLPRESLEGAIALKFEVKSAQNKMENDFSQSYFMPVLGNGVALPFIPYNPPVGDWEARYIELSGVRDLADVAAFRIGGNPRGTQCTFWIRNIEILEDRDSPAESSRQ